MQGKKNPKIRGREISKIAKAIKICKSTTTDKNDEQGYGGCG
jgi:hypothetical protein